MQQLSLHTHLAEICSTALLFSYFSLEGAVDFLVITSEQKASFMHFKIIKYKFRAVSVLMFEAIFSCC